MSVVATDTETLPTQRRTPPGRAAGIPNRTTTAIVEMIIDTLHAKPEGGRAYLNSLDKALFTKLIARILPKDINITGTITFEHRLAELEASKALIDGVPVQETTVKALPGRALVSSQVLDALALYKVEHPDLFTEPAVTAVEPHKPASLASQAEHTEAEGDGVP